jgi:hypothetical protein
MYSRVIPKVASGSCNLKQCLLEPDTYFTGILYRRGTQKIQNIYMTESGKAIRSARAGDIPVDLIATMVR